MKITGPLFWCQVLWFAECAPDHRFLFLCVWPAQLARLFSCFPNKRMCDSATFLHLVWMQPWVKHFRKKVRGCFCVWALCVMSYLLWHTCGRKKDNYFEHVLPKTTWLLKAKQLGIFYLERAMQAEPGLMICSREGRDEGRNHGFEQSLYFKYCRLPHVCFDNRLLPWGCTCVGSRQLSGSKIRGIHVTASCFRSSPDSKIGKSGYRAYTTKQVHHTKDVF